MKEVITAIIIVIIVMSPLYIAVIFSAYCALVGTGRGYQDREE